jgi:hypothetical protein
VTKTRVEVWTRGGVIQDIQKPDDVEVVVYDGDVCGYSENEIETDRYGTDCIKITW